MTLSTLTLADLARLYRGFQAITSDEFIDVTGDRGSSHPSFDGVDWFCADPIGYCTSRRPATQGEALLALALKKAEGK